MKNKFLSSILLVAVLLALIVGTFVPAQAASQMIPVTVTLVDSTGAPLSGAQVIYTKGPNANNGWYQFGTTDVNGKAVNNLPANSASMIRVNVGVTQSTQTISIGTQPTSVQFQTAKITVEAKTCAGKPISNVNFAYMSNLNTALYPFGITGVDGKTSKELFPWTLKFVGTLVATQSTQEANVTNGSVVTFQTTNVAINSSENITYFRSRNNGLYPFNKSGTEMLPGTYSFQIGNDSQNVFDLNVSGCSYSGNLVTIKLIDSAGKGLSGATAQYYDGSWKTIPGTTDANGKLYALLPTLKNSTPFNLTYNGATQRIDQNIATNPTVTFQTKKVVVSLVDSKGAALTGTPQFYASKWQSFGNGATGSTMELLPGSYPFTVTYHGATQRIDQNIASNSNVVFTTKPVTVSLVDSNGAALTGTPQFYASKWQSFGNGATGSTMELLPGSYPFTVTYLGATQRIDQNIASDSNVVFTTKPVTVTLVDSNGAALTGTPQFYASKWQTFGNGSTGSSMELLPGSYPFTVTYLGATQRIDQNIASDSNVVFTTKPVTVSLVDSTGVALTGTPQFYASKWQVFGNGATSSTMELLPGSYPFTVTYLGATQRIDQNIANNANVVFATKPVTVSLVDSNGVVLSGGAAQFYASKWQVFGNGFANSSMELLPGSYPFTVAYQGATQRIDQNIASNSSVTFTVAAVVVAPQPNTPTLDQSILDKFTALSQSVDGYNGNGLSPELVENLKAKISAAHDSYTSGNSAAAINTLNDFITDLATARDAADGSISNDAFYDLNDKAQAIMTVLD